MEPFRIAFICTGNSCRSQMAEAFANHFGAGKVQAISAGLAPSGLDPRTVLVMQEKKIDVSGQRSKDLKEIPLEAMDLVVTLCGEAEESCPVLPSPVEKDHWPLEDPVKAKGKEGQVLDKFRQVRDQIEILVRKLLVARFGDL